MYLVLLLIFVTIISFSIIYLKHYIELRKLNNNLYYIRNTLKCTSNNSEHARKEIRRVIENDMDQIHFEIEMIKKAMEFHIKTPSKGKKQLLNR
jgi:hypothetical protein